MGKLKKKDVASTSIKQGEEKQTKISSFFGNKFVAKQESALFTKIHAEKTCNPNEKCSHVEEHNTKKHLSKSIKIDPQERERSGYIKDNKENDEDVVILDCDGLQEIEKQSFKPPTAKSLCSVGDNCKESKSNSKGKLNNKRDKSAALLSVEAINSDSGELCSDIATKLHCNRPDDDRKIIPSADAGVAAKFVTPEKKFPEYTSDSSPEVICDTPGADLELQASRVRKRKLYASRSFLCSSDRVTVQPGLKPAHLRIQGKVWPRKLLGSVSVSFKEKSKPEASSASSISLDDLIDQHRKSEGNSALANHPIAFKSLNGASGQPYTIPETQPESRSSIQATGAETGIEHYSSDNDESCHHVAAQSVHDLDLTVGSLKSAHAKKPGTENRDTDLPLGAHSGQSFAKSTSWDRTEVRKDKDLHVLPGISCYEGSGRSDSRSKLLGALKTAEVRAQEEEGKLWLKDRIMKDILQDSSDSAEQDKVTTPVKIYPGKNSKIKRRAEAGASPVSKRAHSSDNSRLGEEINDKTEYADSLMRSGIKKVLNYESLTSSHPVKSSSKKCHKFTRQRAQKFGLKPKVKDSGVSESVTLKDDRVLADLLTDLNCSNNSTNAVKSKETAKHLVHKPDPLKIIKDRKHLKGQIQEEDEKMLNALFGESVVNTDSDVEEMNASTFSEKSIQIDQTEPILIEESEKPAGTDSEVCIVIEEDSENPVDYLENNKTLSLPSIIGEEKTEPGIPTTSSMVDNDEKWMSTVPVSSPTISIVGQESIKMDVVTGASPALSRVGEESISMSGVPATSSTISTVGQESTKIAVVPGTSPAVSRVDKERLFSAHDPSSIVDRWGKTDSAVDDSYSLPECEGNLINEQVNDRKTPSSPQQIGDETPRSKSRAISSVSFVTSGNNPVRSPDNSKIPSTCKENQLSTSICDMLSESFDDGFLAPQSLSEGGPKKKQDFIFTDLWNRFTVTDFKYQRESDELLLDLRCERTHVNRLCVLKGFWVDTEVEKGDAVNVLAGLENGRFVVDDKRGLVVVNPDTLLSGTLVVSAVFCRRKSVLNEQFKGVDKGNIQMLYGSIIHSLFQEVLRDGITQEKDVEALAVSCLKSSKFLHEMYGRNLFEETVMEEVKQYIPSLMAWLRKHTSVSNSSTRNFKTEKKPDVMVTEIQDIEENIWSPRFGLKGKIDLTVQAKLTKADAGSDVKVLPLELKTGKASFSAEHKGQVTLYSMMCSDRRADPEEGILLYLKHGQMQTVPVKPESKSGLIQLRNMLAKELSRQVTFEMDETGSKSYVLGRLPEPINNERACRKCAHLQTCSMYQRYEEKAERPAEHAMSSLVPEALAHLGEADLSYFLHWVLCMGVESQESGRKQLQHIWGSSSLQREKDGECISNLIITGSELGIPESQSFSDGQGCSLSFSRHPSCQGAALNSIGLTCGDMVVLSSEDGALIALATGFVRNISAELVEVVVDRDYLHNTAMYQDVKFRLDRNNSFSTYGYLYTNLSKLMDPEPQGAWLRDLIIKKRPPVFELRVSKANLYKVKSVFKPLNKPQRTAILKVLMAKDYVLIKGYPGTGKTSTIVALVKILHLLGLSVLLTSYTHSAVDNILIKLKKEEVPFVRLGRQGRIHPSIQAHSAEVLTRSPHINSVQTLKEFYNSYGVVATSCLGVSNHPVFSQRHFDVCIVDEASQVLQPACLAPLFHCRKFVLVGDPKQLPPVVQSKQARKLGMDVSLFARLDNSGATYDLSLQYRMNSVIMELSNKLVYEGRLQCGDPGVAEQCLKMDNAALVDRPKWMEAALSSHLQNSVVFVDTHQISAPEIQDGKGLKNYNEACIILSLLQTLINGQVSGDSIGVISPYRSQVRLLQQMVSEYSAVPDVEVNTVDQYQGRDKGIIIVSFVRSETDNAGELLKDIRRLNVAMTRARYKLILVGNSSALQSYENLAALLDWLQQSQNIVTLPEDYFLDT